MPRISVSVRIRPDQGIEGGAKAPRRLDNLLVSSDQRSIDFRVTETQHSFTFNQIFKDETSQEGIYDGTMRNLVEGALDGYNGCIFAYGQTGAGKTYTMSGNLDGDEESYGLVPRTALEIFRLAKKSSESFYSFRLSVLEIYNEVLFDLLVEQSDSIPAIAFNSTVSNGGGNDNLKDSKLTILELDSGVVVPNLRIMPVNSAYDAIRLLQEAQANRAIAEHQLNQRSSRSHIIYTFYVTRSVASLSGASHTAENNSASDPIVHQSKLHLVDLAGSERVNKTGSVGMVQKEANYINRSLSYLEQVVVALTQSHRDHIPYRQSKLTHLVKDSLGGNCQTVLVACIWPRRDYAWETLSTMRFAARMKNIETNPVRNRLVAHDSGANGQGYASSGQLRSLQLQLESMKRELVLRDFIYRQEKLQYMKQHQLQPSAQVSSEEDLWLPELTKLQRQQSSSILLQYMLPMNREDHEEGYRSIAAEPLPYTVAEDLPSSTPLEINSLSQMHHYISVLKRAMYIASGYDDQKLREAMVQAIACVHFSQPVPSSVEQLQSIAAEALSSSSGGTGAGGASPGDGYGNSAVAGNKAAPSSSGGVKRSEERFLADILEIAGLAPIQTSTNHTEAGDDEESSRLAMARGTPREDAAHVAGGGPEDTEAVPLTSRTSVSATKPSQHSAHNIPPFSPDSDNHFVQGNQRLKKEELFKQFTAAEGAGKDWQHAYDDACEALKNSKSRQREIVTYLNTNKADIDRYSTSIADLNEQLESQTHENVDDDNEDNADVKPLSEEEKQVLSASLQEQKQKLDEVKRNYRAAYQEMQICKEQIEEMHSLKKRTMTALLAAFDTFYRQLYSQDDMLFRGDNSDETN